MKQDSSHIKQIKVISNTHWDREFRKSFEKTRRNLLTMLDKTIQILEDDPEYHSFTMDGHCIMIDDYLEMRPEMKDSVTKLIESGRLIIGPYYTLAEQFSISHEALVRNLIWGQKTIEKYNGKMGTVAYTPSSWGQTGQLPQILKDFGLGKMMFYRGISHHESDAEYVWSAPDGTQVLASRFALYARYNWYYQVHRAVTRGKVFNKDYNWGEYDEIPMRIADSFCEEGQSYELKAPALCYDETKLKHAIEEMVKAEGPHFTTEVFLAMHGHDISVAHPFESKIINDAKKYFKDIYVIEHTDLETYWNEVEKHLDIGKMPVLTGERRSYLKEGKWTFLFPGTISARTYLKQKDFDAYTGLTYYAEPIASLALCLGNEYPSLYMNRGWQYLLSNHTHDANGGCAPDAVCMDMEYRYRKTCDIGDIVTEDSMAYVITNLNNNGISKETMLLTVFNTLPYERNVIITLDVEVPKSINAKSLKFISCEDEDCITEIQPICTEKSSVFMDSIWEVPTILDSNRFHLHAAFNNIPALGYKTYQIEAQKNETRKSSTLISGSNTMENKELKVQVNENGTVDILNKKTGKNYKNLNYLSNQGECGNAWKHVSPEFDRIYTSLSETAKISITESGSLSSTITAELSFSVPEDYADGRRRNDRLVELSVKIEYTLEKNSNALKVKLSVNNVAKDHWLRVNFPTRIDTNITWSDSHYDVISRQIKLPDSTGWIEPAEGTHPLRTFVSIEDGINGLALFPKGLFEYEAFDNEEKVLALTLIRACRIKLAVSEEKMTELPDLGIQCPGLQVFEYAIHIHEGSWKKSGLLKESAKYYTPVRSVVSGRGKGNLPFIGSFLEINQPNIHMTCMKQAENKNGVILRFFNPCDEAVTTCITFGYAIKKALLSKMNEQDITEMPMSNNQLEFNIEAKKIMTIRVILA